MVRAVLFLVILAAVAFGVSWLADQPGTVSVVWLGRQIEFEVLTGLVFLVVAAALIMLAIAFMKWLIASPAIAARALRRRRRAKGQEAISRGIVAIGAGDRRAAEKHAHDAERLAPDEPLTLLLQAQAAQLAGDRAGAERAFRAMLDRPETRVLGLRGLYVEAQRRADPVSARAIAEEAVKAAPGAGWAAQAVLEGRTLGGDWDGAMAAVERQYAARVIDRDTARRHRAVLLTAKALAAEDHDPRGAKAMALEAHNLAPGLVPAAALAGRLTAAEGDARKAAKIVEAAWRITPHPDLAEAYAHARHGDSRLDQLHRVEALARLTPSHPEGLLAVARAAIDAGEFATARRALEELPEGQTTQRACLLWAELVAKESADHGRAREWTVRALRAPRDPAWTADGQASDVWLPASPVTGRLDAFQWRVPVAELGGPTLHVDVDEVLADIAEPEADLPEIVAAVPEPETPAPAPVAEAEPPPAPVEAAEPEPPAPPASPAGEPEPIRLAEPLPASEEPKPEEPKPSAPEEAAPATPRPRLVPTETVFPMARAPDDPGPERQEETRRASFFSR